MPMAPPQKQQNNVLTISLVLIFFFGIVLTFFLAPRLFTQLSQTEPASGDLKECKTVGKEYTIRDTLNGFVPNALTVHVCDKVTFVNDTTGLIYPAFGEHEHHTQLPGFREKVIGPHQTNSLILLTPGTISFHDHLHEENGGLIEVRQ